MKKLLILGVISAILLAGCGSKEEDAQSKELVPKRPAAVMQYYKLAEEYNALDDEIDVAKDAPVTQNDEHYENYKKLATKLRKLNLQSGDKLAEACDILADPKGDPIDAVGLAKEARELAAEDK